MAKKKIPNTKPAHAVAKRAQAEMMVASFDRMQKAKAIYDHQNDTARDAIDRIQSLLIRQSRRVMLVGKGDQKVQVEIPKDAIWNNALFMAVELVKDLAYMDIRVADFNWPSDLCIECGGPVHTRARKKVAR